MSLFKNGGKDVLINFNNQKELEITNQDLISFYTVIHTKDMLGLNLDYENSLDNIRRKRLTFRSGTTTVSAEVSRLAMNKLNGYEEIAACMKIYDYFTINDNKKHIYSCSSVSEIWSQ